MKDLTKGNTFKTLLLFAIPMLISGVVTQSYNLIDLIIAGKVIGSDALGATGSTTTLIQFLSSLFWGFGVAVSTVVGELFGANKKDRIVNTIQTIIIFVALTMLVLSAICIILARQILTLLKVDPLIFEPALQYFQIYMVALFIQSISYQITCILQSLGNSKYPMVMNLISGALNLILNIIFVVIFNLGINGIAYATVISSILALAFGTIKIISTIKELGGNPKLKMDFASLKQVSILAIPCIIQQCSLYLSSVVVQPFINNMGKAVSAGYSIAMNVNVLLNAVYHSISRSVASYTSQSKGANKFNNFTKGIYIGVLLQVILILPWALAFAIFPDQLFALFLKNNDSSVLPYATQYVKLCLPFLIFVAYGNLMHSFYKSVEAVKTVLVTTTLFTFCRIVLTYTIPNTNLINAVYISLSLAWVFEGVLQFVAYYLGKWKSKEQIEFESKKRNVLS